MSLRASNLSKVYSRLSMSPAGKLLHWGPLLGISLLLCVTLTTAHFYVQMYFPLMGVRSWLEFTLCASLTIAMVHCYVSTILDSPGFVAHGWRPEKQQDQQCLEYCARCQCWKPPRSHHCSRCGRCVLKMDHHCYFVNGCLGHRNQKYFLLSVLLCVIGSVVSLVVLYNAVIRVVYSVPNSATGQYIFLSLNGLFLLLFTITVDLVGVFGMGPLLYTLARSLLCNETLIEARIVAKANQNAKKDGTPFIYPYNVGLWRNVRQVLFQPLTDGIEWPVRDGCHQYSLTMEQLQQKQRTMRNAIKYRAISTYNGHYFPLFSQGIMVSLTLPWNIKPRLALQLNDDLLVVEGNNRWLLGIKSKSKDVQQGWFPAKCVRRVEESGENENDTIKHESGDEEALLGSDSDSQFSIEEFIENLSKQHECKKQS